MNVQTFAYRFVLANILTLYYNVCVLLLFLFNYMKNPFGDPFALKPKLEPPACLTDPKYGKHQYIKVNNIKLHYVESGDPSKTLMIFVHGFPEFWYSWRHQILEFQKDYWCIAIDLRGYADSERPDGKSPYRLEILVEDIRDLVRQLGREKCIIVSHDWGGLICCRLRDMYPEILSGYIVLASTTREALVNEVWNNSEQRKKSWYIFMMRVPWVAEKLLQMNNLAAIDDCFLVRGKNTITRNDVECYKYWFGKQHTLTPPINYYRVNFEYVVPEKKYCETNIPFLLAMAENDPYLNLSLIDAVKKEYKYVETTIIKGCGHYLQQEEPQVVNKIIRDFLNKHNL